MIITIYRKNIEIFKLLILNKYFPNDYEFGLLLKMNKYEYIDFMIENDYEMTDYQKCLYKQ